MSNLKPGTVVVALKDAPPVEAGSLGVVKSSEQDPATWGFKSVTVDFGFRKKQGCVLVLNDLSTISVYPSKSKLKDGVEAK